MNENEILLRVTEQYVRSGKTTDDQTKVTLIPDNKTSFVEYIGVDGRTIYLNEYHVDGKIIWAGYSSRTQTVFLSLCN